MFSQPALFAESKTLARSYRIRRGVWFCQEMKEARANYAENFLCNGCAHAFPYYVQKQELLTELPNDTCAIPEPLEIPTIPEGEDRNDSSETPPASANVESLDMNRLDQTADLAGDQTPIHAGRDRLAERMRCICPQPCRTILYYNLAVPYFSLSLA